LRRQKPDRPEIAEAAAQLGRLAEAQPDLADAARLQAALLRAAYAAPAAVAPSGRTREAIAASLAAGAPLLRGHPLPAAEGDLRAAFARLCAAADEVLSSAGAPEAPPRSLPQRVDVVSLAGALLAGDGAAIPARLEAQGLPAELVSALLRFALLPFLEQAAAQLAPLWAEQQWQRGCCPCCGAWPLMGEQRGLDQARYGRCGLCVSSWRLERVCCPFCGERDHRRLGYLAVEGDEQQRVFTCESCGGYLKLRSVLAPLSAPQLLVAEIAMLHLDLVAMESGYLAPG
jgi:FdhE protein